MKPREYVLEQIRHRETRPVPYSLGFEDGTDKLLDDHYGTPFWRERSTLFGWNPSPMAALAMCLVASGGWTVALGTCRPRG